MPNEIVQGSSPNFRCSAKAANAFDPGNWPVCAPQLPIGSIDRSRGDSPDAVRDTDGLGLGAQRLQLPGFLQLS